MSFRKRITEMLTPPIRHSSDREEFGSKGGGEIGGAARIGEILNRLLCDASSSKEAVRIELEALRKIAVQYGSYLTACEIQECVLRMPNANEGGHVFRKGRGFELAADLHYQSLVGRIKGAGDGTLSIETDEFAKYFGELLESYFSAKKHRKGIQVCIGICEDLLTRGCGSSRGAKACPGFANASMVAMMDLALREKERTDRKFNRAKRDHRRFNTPMPEESAPPDSVDGSLLSYIDGYRLQVAQVELGMARLQYKVELDFRSLTGSEARSDIENLLGFVESVRKIANNAQCQILEAFAYEQAGIIKESLSVGSGVELISTGARLYENCAGKEVELKLGVLCRRHFEKAAELWALAGNAEGVERVQSFLVR